MMNALRKEQTERPDAFRRPTAAERLARKPLWRQAEDYFRRHRDRKLPVTLPRVSCLERADD